MFNDANYRPQSPNSVPFYSNIAYNLLGRALESVHPNESYAAIIKKLIFDPACMKTAGFDTPKNASEAILPGKGEQWFAEPFENYDPSGGIWVTPKEFHTFAQALRSNKLLSAVETRKWLQPRASLPSLYQLVGAPWEIIRPIDLDIKFPRPIDIYTKSGSVTGYASYLILIPEYDITITMTAGGNSATSALSKLISTVIRPLVAHADRKARNQALARYGGTYRPTTTVNSNSSLTLTLDGGPGLKISSFTMNGANVIAGLAAMQKKPVGNASARLYPYDTDAWVDGKQVWRLQLDGPLPTIDSWAELDCASWLSGDVVRYVGSALDMLEVKVDKKGKAEEIYLSGWQSSLKKVN